MKTTITSAIIPAAPGWRTLYRDVRELFIGQTVLAWRIETIERWDVVGDGVEHRFVSEAFAIEPHGDAVLNLWGYLRPDGAVEDIEGDSHASLAAAEEAMRDRDKTMPRAA